MHKIYINDLFNSNSYPLFKLIIPKKLLIEIKKDIIGDEKVKLKFLNNFDIVNIKEVKNLFRNLIIFNKNNNIYFYYEYMYLFENNKFKKIKNENEIFHEKTSLKKSDTKKASKSKKKERKKKDEIINLNIKCNTLNDIKQKIEKIDLLDLNKEEYEGKCFCFLIMSKSYVKKFFE